MGFKNIYWNGWIYVEIYVRCINEYWIPMELNVWAESSWDLEDLSKETINMRVEYFLCKASVSGEGKQELKYALRDFS